MKTDRTWSTTRTPRPRRWCGTWWKLFTISNHRNQLHRHQHRSLSKKHLPQMSQWKMLRKIPQPRSTMTSRLTSRRMRSTSASASSWSQPTRSSIMSLTHREARKAAASWWSSARKSSPELPPRTSSQTTGRETYKSYLPCPLRIVPKSIQFWSTQNRPESMGTCITSRWTLAQSRSDRRTVSG